MGQCALFLCWAGGRWLHFRYMYCFLCSLRPWGPHVVGGRQGYYRSSNTVLGHGHFFFCWEQHVHVKGPLVDFATPRVAPWGGETEHALFVLLATG